MSLDTTKTPRRTVFTLVGTSIVCSFMLVGLVSSCMSLRQPSNTADLCIIFAEKSYWYRHAVNAEKQWNIDKTILMAVIKQESSFVRSARPPRTRILGVIPWKRPTTAYGYAQAIDETWGDYKERNAKPHANRTNFRDAIDFVGWYLDMAATTANVPRDDAKNLYLTYHEGITGYIEGTWKGKKNVLVAATKVSENSNLFEAQLEDCDRGPARRR